MRYQQVLRRLYRRNEFSIKLGLKNIERLLELLGNPQHTFPAIHIAGTNGKGSVAAMIAGALSQAKYKTGLYTSPHLIDFRERIQVNSRRISKQRVVQGLQKIDSLIRKETRRHKNFSPTYFEVTTALALDFFAQKKIDVAVLETGLGGRLDATNACRPLVTILTHVERDHEHWLGNTLTQIACEKAGIMKPHVPFLTAEKKKNIRVLLKRIARQKKAPFLLCPPMRRRTSQTNKHEETFDYHGKKWHWRRVSLNLLGSHQVENAVLAMRALEELQGKGFSFSQAGVRHALRHIAWPGRFHVFPGNPKIVLDGAHNVEAIQTFLRTLKEKKLPKPIFIFGMMQDKDIPKVSQLLATCSQTFFLVQAKVSRAAPVHRIEQELKKCSPQGTFYPVGDMKKALRRARRQYAGKKVTLCVCGSLYLVGEALKILFSNETQRNRLFGWQ